MSDTIIVPLMCAFCDKPAHFPFHDEVCREHARELYGTPHIATKYGRQPDGSLYVPRVVARELYEALRWLGRSRGRNFLGETSPSVEHLEKFAELFGKATDFCWEEYT